MKPRMREVNPDNTIKKAKKIKMSELENTVQFEMDPTLDSLLNPTDVK